MMFWLSGTVISSGIGCEPFQLLCLECVRMESKMLEHLDFPFGIFVPCYYVREGGKRISRSMILFVWGLDLLCFVV